MGALAPGQERGVVVGRFSERQFHEQPGEVTVRIDAVRLAGLDERVEIGTGLCAGDSVCEQPALAANDE